MPTPAYSEDDREYHIQCRKGDVGRYVILPGDPKRVEKIAAYLEDARFVADSREFLTWTGTLLGEPVSVTSTGIGGPSASIAMEELCNCGADTFIRTGTCGGMQPEIESGDIAIANGAVRMEGTSREIAPLEYPAVPDVECLMALMEAAGTLGFRYHVGVSQCKDTLYGQHSPEQSPVGYELIDKWEAWKKLGCIASEMESAALFITAAKRRVRCGSCFLVIGNQERQKAGLPNPIVRDTDASIRVAVEAVKNLIRKDREKESR